MTVANRYYPYNLTIPAGKTPAAPLSTKVVFEDLLLRYVDIRIPPGPNGNVGFYVSAGGTPIIPWGNPPVWIIANNEAIRFDVNAEINGGVVVVAYNTGVWAHTLYFRFAGTPVSLIPTVTPVATIVPIQ